MKNVVNQLNLHIQVLTEKAQITYAGFRLTDGKHNLLHEFPTLSSFK